MATFPFLLKVTGATVLSGAIALGAMTTWEGKETVTTAITTIQEQASNLGVYETNETQLVNKIDELKTLRADLQNQVSVLTTQNEDKQAEIDRLMTQIESLDAQIVSLETDLSTANENGESLSERIDALEAELQTANADIERLQAELDANTSTSVPLTETEMATILEK